MGYRSRVVAVFYSTVQEQNAGYKNWTAMVEQAAEFGGNNVKVKEQTK